MKELEELKEVIKGVIQMLEEEHLQAGAMEVLGHTLITAGQGLLLMARRIKQEKKREAERN